MRGGVPSFKQGLKLCVRNSHTHKTAFCGGNSPRLIKIHTQFIQPPYRTILTFRSHYRLLPIQPQRKHLNFLIFLIYSRPFTIKNSFSNKKGIKKVALATYNKHNYNFQTKHKSNLKHLLSIFKQFKQLNH